MQQTNSASLYRHPSVYMHATWHDMIWHTIRSVLEYCCKVWHSGLTKQQRATIEHLQNLALLIPYPDLRYKEVLEVAGLTTLAQRREDHNRQLFEKMQDTTHKLHHLLLPKRTDNCLRHNMNYELPRSQQIPLKSPINYCLFHFQACKK